MLILRSEPYHRLSFDLDAQIIRTHKANSICFRVKSRFAWIGEIENEQLLTALETLKTEDLEIITMYAYEGYDITEISKVYGVSRPTISIKIKRITKFLKNFNFNATN